MRRGGPSLLAVLALAGIALAAPARLAAGSPNNRLTVSISDRLRHESVDWFGNGSRYGFAANQLRLNLRLALPHLELGVEAQHTLLSGLPAGASGGPGAAYFAAGGETDQGEAFLRQVFLTARGGDFAATLGRFDYAEGLEAVAADPALGWLRRSRVAERLVGPFGWSHVGRSFQGARLVFDRPATNVTAVVARPTAGGFLLHAGDPLADVGFGLLAWTVRPPAESGAAAGEARAFALFYEDARPLAKVDNRPSAERAADRTAIRLQTAGGHAAAVVAAGAAHVDLLLWGTVQDGEWGRLDHRAWAFATEGGVQWRGSRWTPWLRAGWNLSSGDRDAGDDRHGTFFQMLPTARIYAQFPFYNLMNLDDRFVQLVLAPRPGWTARLDLHALRLAEPADLWYAGAGATTPGGFGVTGLPSGGERDLATVADLALAARLDPHWSVQAYVARARGGAALARSFPLDRATYAYLEVLFRY